MPGQHPEDSVGDCVESVLDDHPEYDESQAYAICNAEHRGVVTLRGVSDEALRAIRRRHDPDVVQLAGDEVTLEGVGGDAVGAILTRYNATAVPADDTGSGAVMGDDSMTPRQRSTAATGFDVVGGPAPAVAQRADDGFDPDDPPAEYADAIEADDFVIYGKASIQQTDDMGTRISVAALEDALDRFFDSRDAPGIISRGHADVVVGMPVREHTLESDTTLVIDGETYEYDAGETIRTEAKDADGDDVPELWLASRLANDSDIARETRYKALTGELNGYSVTVKPKDGATERTGDGEDILAVDLHAVTVGTDDQILNKGSEFDVAEFRAWFDGSDHPTDIDAVLAQLTDDAVDTLAEDLGRELRTLFQ